MSLSKRELRRQLRRKRRDVPPRERRRWSEAIFENWQSEFVNASLRTLHCFISMPDQGEPDTSPFVRWAHTSGLQLVIPRVAPGDPDLHHHVHQAGEPLVTSAWGIPEPPQQSDRFDIARLDMVLVPLLAFDPVGHRLGYGGGYYDRFLARLPAACRKVGIAFELSRRQEHLPSHSGDVRLDAVVTEQGVHRF